ncbi:M48 family metallopeptidase [Pollutibacter soli]|uniref:M48 family metallopeptidase n=1 Tax=Pollutibacter soli TaxID=3034157 RepID=UPI0030137E00
MRILLFLLVGTLSLSSCQKNKITGRNQLMLVSESEVNAMALQEYKSFLSQNPVVPKGSTPEQQMVTRVGQRIASAITSYYSKQGKSELLNGYQWEFNLVQSKEVNAWCMPGGKVVVYTGILPVTQTETALAVVMGHEIAHALALHGNERMSQGLAQQLGGAALSVALSSKPAETQQLFMAAYGIGSNVGVLLPYSRKQELEADQYGLIFAAMAGYNPQEAVSFWQRMASMSGGQKPPELLSTHPSDQTRIEKVQQYAKQAMKYYKPGTQRAK